jgi:hypothetical protein
MFNGGTRILTTFFESIAKYLSEIIRLLKLPFNVNVINQPIQVDQIQNNHSVQAYTLSNSTATIMSCRAILIKNVGSNLAYINTNYILEPSTSLSLSSDNNDILTNIVIDATNTTVNYIIIN